jgi:preprotein translocase subunit SecE
MASDTKMTPKEDKAMAADTTIAPTGDEPRDERPSTAERAAAPKPGFFAIYKKGQGYWTRMGTAIGAGLLGALMTWQIYRYVPAFIASPTTDAGRGQRVAMIVAGVFVTIYAFFAWRLMNKPGNVDFLIATDSEMKKVNWTSKRELIGSTKVVIIFMFGIALFLFLLDQIFNIVFYLIDVLKIAPPWWKYIFGG